MVLTKQTKIKVINFYSSNAEIRETEIVSIQHLPETVLNANTSEAVKTVKGLTLYQIQLLKNFWFNDLKFNQKFIQRKWKIL